MNYFIIRSCQFGVSKNFSSYKGWIKAWIKSLIKAGWKLIDFLVLNKILLESIFIFNYFLIIKKESGFTILQIKREMEDSEAKLRAAFLQQK